MWEDLINKAKEGGLDVVETYVFWNVHEPSPGNVLHSFLISVQISLSSFMFCAQRLNLFFLGVFSTILKEDMTW